MPLFVVLCLLLVGFLLFLPQAPPIDAHPEWQGVWNKAHLAISRSTPRAYWINLALVLVVSWFACACVKPILKP